MENRILITGKQFSVYDNFKEEPQSKQITGSIILDFVSCGDFGNYVNEKGELDKVKFIEALNNNSVEISSTYSL